MNKNTVIQCDFDGTITEKDVSFFLLDRFASKDWRGLLEEYRQGKISVGKLNTDAFSLVKADEETLLQAMRGEVKIRAGFLDVVDFCHNKGIHLHIVSNGLDFYIREILKILHLESIPFFAAQTTFHPDGMKVVYKDPDGTPMDSGLKTYFVNSYLRKGYNILYAGNGPSDLEPARLCHRIFATGELVSFCREAKVPCTTFTDFLEMLDDLKTLDL
jgi:2-hydroxy-3-keto-5-methylthiopentenyl-1-phosphate phosphatase